MLSLFLTQANKVTDEYGGSVAVMHILPVRYPAAATNLIPDVPERTNLVYPVGDMPAEEKELLEKEHSGMCITQRVGRNAELQPYIHCMALHP